MAKSVVDRTSNKPEQIKHAAEVLGRSELKRKVFKAAYTGQQRRKSATDLMRKTHLSQKQVLSATKSLVDNELINVERIKGGASTFGKEPFFQSRRDTILKLAANKTAREAMVTKRNPTTTKATVKPIKIQLKLRLSKRFAAKQIFVEDIDNFKEVKRQPNTYDNVKMPETKFKTGIAKLLLQKGSFKDWGGESNDLFSSHLRIKGKRLVTAFAFKGPGMSGELKPGKMGKNGDQIQRLAKCPAKVFLVQYWNGINESVLDQLQQFVSFKGLMHDEQLYYGLIDGQDSARLIAAYPRQFGIKEES